jgi:hypothetical protein
LTASTVSPAAGGRADAFVTAAARLAGLGDLALALEILAAGLLRHPDYAQLTGAELSPVG